MILKIQIIDDQGQIMMEQSGPVHQPLQWKAPPNSPVISLREGDNGAYKVWAITVVPTVVLELGYGKLLNPNAYKIF